jgi:hypothetical protein
VCLIDTMAFGKQRYLNTYMKCCRLILAPVDGIVISLGREGSLKDAANPKSHPNCERFSWQLAVSSYTTRRSSVKKYNPGLIVERLGPARYLFCVMESRFPTAPELCLSWSHKLLQRSEYLKHSGALVLYPANHFFSSLFSARFVKISVPKLCT